MPLPMQPTPPIAQPIQPRPLMPQIGNSSQDPNGFSKLMAPQPLPPQGMQQNLLTQNLNTPAPGIIGRPATPQASLAPQGLGQPSNFSGNMGTVGNAGPGATQQGNAGGLILGNTSGANAAGAGIGQPTQPSATLGMPSQNQLGQNLGTTSGLQQAPAAPTQSIEQQALAGGNKQQISNFMTALGNVGAGGNNNQMGVAAPQAAQSTQLVNPATATQSNAGTIPVGQPTVNGGQGMMGPGGQMSSGSNPIGTPPATSAGSNPVTVKGIGYPTGQVSAPPVQQPLQSIGGRPMPVVSDENLKTNITSGQKSLMDFMNKIQAHQYQYKNPVDGAGTYVSPMAQELEATELGKSAVIETPRGKMVDYARLGGINLAAAAVLQQQVNHLRSQFKLKGK